MGTQSRSGKSLIAPSSLEEDEEGEEKYPEHAHGVPVPSGAVHDDLAEFDAAQDEHGGERSGESDDAKQQMESVDAGDEVEEVAARVRRVVVEALLDELLPGDPLAGEEERAEDKGGDQPRSSALDGGTAEAEPLVHDVDFPEKLAAGHLHGEAAEDENGGVDPENGRDGERVPVGDVVLAGVEVAGTLAHEEGADQSDEEHEVAGKGEEDSETVAGEQFARAATAMGAIIPVVAVASSAGWPAVEWGFSAYAGVFALNLNWVASKGGGHDGPLTMAFSDLPDTNFENAT